MLKSILLASALVLGLAATATASSTCGEDENAGNGHVKNWCDSKSQNRSDSRGGQNNGQN